MNVRPKSLLLTEIEVVPQVAAEAWAHWCRAWCSLDVPSAAYRSGQTSFLEVTEVGTRGQLVSVLERHRLSAHQMEHFMSSDWRRELLTHVKDVKRHARGLPISPHLQLRHIEVPLSEYRAYCDWREQTIFPFVRRAPEVEEFLVYRSAFSTRPGVMFLSSFSCEIEQYLGRFETDEYRRIVVDASSRFILGGTAGLYTKVFSDRVAWTWSDG